MNAVEIEEAVSKLAEAPFEPTTFPYAFLEAFGNKETTLKRLRTGNTNQSDVGGVLQRGNIHIKVAPPGDVAATLNALRDSPATARHKARFILATDGVDLHAEQLVGDVPPLACAYTDLPNHFAFFLPLAGITTVRAIADDAFDIRATGRLNRLYVELLKTNSDWDTDARREELNHFFARLIFCFFAEDTGIFDGNRLFTDTLETMTERDGSNTHQVLARLFEAMNTPPEKRAESDLPPSALKFPYVNGNLFAPTNRARSKRDNDDTFTPTSRARSKRDNHDNDNDHDDTSIDVDSDPAYFVRDSYEVPKFSKIARSYLLFIGGLDWKLINPDIFGSMIQAIADDEERGALGMHYTSVPNILKVLNPLFLDDLRQKLAEAGDGSTPASKGQLKRLRDRMARIRVFDPACGSGNFLVIAYIHMRKIEAEINERRGERELPSVIPSTNFRGIEIRHFAAEIARLALIIARFQCDAKHIGDLFARQQVLPLDKDNWITCGNALRLDWLQICPPTGTGVKVAGDDLFNTPKDQSEIDFENEGGETYICGNPPYLGSTWQTDDQKDELKSIFESRTKTWASLDYVAGWFMKAADYGTKTNAAAAFVATNSICQGQQVPILWPIIFGTGHEIGFAHTSFKWKNLASHNAGVTVAIVGLTNHPAAMRPLYSIGEEEEVVLKQAACINAYLVPGPNVIVTKRSGHDDDRSEMDAGGKPVEGGHLMLTADEAEKLIALSADTATYVKRVYGANEYVKGQVRHCLWIDDDHVNDARSLPTISDRLAGVATARRKSPKIATQHGAAWPHRFEEVKQSGREVVTIVPKLTAEVREFIPAGLLPSGTIVTDLAFALYDAPIWNLAIINSKLHFIWIATVCGKFKTDYRYSNTLGWNTFPVPALSDQNKADLTRCAEEILLAREAHFPATIANLYDPEKMPADLRAAHDRNDETLERIYIGRRFRNDTERLEKLFELYTQMTAKKGNAKKRKEPRTK